jgi:hypothetical protein
MRRSGHFEFGLDRRPMHLGDPERVQRIMAAWAMGDEIRGLAMYWNMVYGYLARLLASDADVRASALVLRFEDLCARPAATLHTALKHCALPDADSVVARSAPAVRRPTYYASNLSSEDRATIRDETSTTARLWGY